jgi:alkylhydroperoxidase/carboxymuconolactone decarboxylase family protein YurZ
MAIWKQEPIAEYNEFIKTFPELSEKFGDLIRTIMEQPKLDKKLKELIITALLAAQQFESGFKFHVKEAQNRGASREEILETVLLLLPYGNVSSFLKSLWWSKDLGIL